MLYALGLPGIGYVNAKAIAEHFGSIDALLEADAEADRGGRGDRARCSPSQLREELADEAERRADRAAARARACASSSRPPSARAEGGPLEGKTFVLTGTLPNLTREEATRADPAAPAAR